MLLPFIFLTLLTMMLNDSNSISFPDCTKCLDYDSRSESHWKKISSKRRLLNVSMDKKSNFMKKQDSNLFSKWEHAISPILSLSTIFPPLCDHETSQQNTNHGKRVLCIPHTRAEEIFHFLNKTLDHPDVFITTHIFDDSISVLVCWYDCDLTKTHFILLQPILQRFNLTTMDIFFVTNSHPIYKSLYAIKSMHIFLHSFETVYLFSTSFICHLPETQTSVTKVIQNFGRMHSIEFDPVLNCYKCTLANIRTAFTICKFHHFNTQSFEFYACHTPIEAKNLRSKLIYRSLKTEINNLTKLHVKRNIDSKEIIPTNSSLTLTKISSDICIAKIRAGEDNRMTILIRNIPNQIKYQQLKKVIDTVSHEKYSNLHLSINRINLQNFGYAFISFKSPIYIIKFYHYFHNHRWKEYQSTKICSLAYANDQELKLPMDRHKSTVIKR